MRRRERKLKEGITVEQLEEAEIKVSIDKKDLNSSAEFYIKYFIFNNILL